MVEYDVICKSFIYKHLQFVLCVNKGVEKLRGWLDRVSGFTLMFFLVGMQCMIAATLGSTGTKLCLPAMSLNEIQRAVSLVKSDARFGSTMVFLSVQLAEPEKHSVLNGLSSNREVAFVILDRHKNETYEAYADPVNGTVWWKVVGSAQPHLVKGDVTVAAEVMRKHVGWQNALERRNIDSSRVDILIWPSGIRTSVMSSRLVRVIGYYRDSLHLSLLRPIEGLTALVDLRSGRVVQFTDLPPNPIPAAPVPTPPAWTLRKTSSSKQRKSGNKEKSSISIDTNGRVRWKSWQFVPSMTAREGLVLFNLSYAPAGTPRAVAWRISLSEICVPYQDTSIHWKWRSVLVAGEYGMGSNISPVTPGMEVPTNALLVPTYTIAESGAVVEVPSAYAIYQVIDGTDRRYTDTSGRKIVIQDTSLRIEHYTSVGPYQYCIRYSLKPDGSINGAVFVSGMLLTKGVLDTSADDVTGEQMNGSLVAKHLLAPYHPHYFSFRVDLDVDGQKNTVWEDELQFYPQITGRKNLQAPYVDRYELRSEREAIRLSDPLKHRVWRIASDTMLNALGSPTAYRLSIDHPPPSLPQHVIELLTHRAAFIDKEFAATVYKPHERYVSGDYPNQGDPKTGLPQYVQDNERLRGQDVVAWITLGISIIPRAEDWPLLKTTTASFTIMPDGLVNSPGINRK